MSVRLAYFILSGLDGRLGAVGVANTPPVEMRRFSAPFVLASKRNRRYASTHGDWNACLGVHKINCLGTN
jgi:hypothetical protein